MDHAEILYGKSPKPKTKSDLILPDIPRPRGRLVLVAGPPGSGKTTYVRSKKNRGDLVIDLDEIKSKLSGNPLHRSPDDPVLLRRALFTRNRMINKFALESAHGETAWLISGAPSASERRHWRERAGADVTVLETSMDELKSRIASDASRRGREEEMISWAQRWWSEYEPDDGEEVEGSEHGRSDS